MSWAREFIKEAIEPADAAVQRGIRQAGKEARSVIGDAIPQVTSLVDATVRSVDTRARGIVQESLAQTYAYVDRTIANAQGQLSKVVQQAGDELRTSATHAVDRLDATVEKRVAHLEQRTLEVVTQSRREAQELVADLNRAIGGLLIAVGTGAFSAFQVWRPEVAAPARSVAVSSAVVLFGLTAAIASGGAVDRLRRGRSASVPQALGRALADVGPYTLSGAVLAIAALMMR